MVRKLRLRLRSGQNPGTRLVTGRGRAAARPLRDGNPGAAGPLRDRDPGAAGPLRDGNPGAAGPQRDRDPGAAGPQRDRDQGRGTERFPAAVTPAC